jgi:hypothetical protein
MQAVCQVYGLIAHASCAWVGLHLNQPYRVFAGFGVIGVIVRYLLMVYPDKLAHRYDIHVSTPFAELSQLQADRGLVKFLRVLQLGATHDLFHFHINRICRCFAFAVLKHCLRLRASSPIDLKTELDALGKPGHQDGSKAVLATAP